MPPKKAATASRATATASKAKAPEKKVAPKTTASKKKGATKSASPQPTGKIKTQFRCKFPVPEKHSEKIARLQHEAMWAANKAKAAAAKTATASTKGASTKAAPISATAAKAAAPKAAPKRPTVATKVAPKPATKETASKAASAKPTTMKRKASDVEEESSSESEDESEEEDSPPPPKKAKTSSAPPAKKTGTAAQKVKAATKPAPKKPTSKAATAKIKSKEVAPTKKSTVKAAPAKSKATKATAAKATKRKADEVVPAPAPQGASPDLSPPPLDDDSDIDLSSVKSALLLTPEAMRKKPVASQVANKAKATATKAKRSLTPTPPVVKIPRHGRRTVINEVPSTKLNVFVFGEGSSGELGLGSAKTAVDVKRPRFNPNLAGVVYVATGGMHAAAVTHDQKILTWGVNDLGAVGRDTEWEGGLKDMDDTSDDGSDTSDSGSDSGMNPKESTPTAIPAEHFEPGTKFVQLAAGDSCTFAVTDEGYVYGWGTFRNNEGVLGFNANVKVQMTPTYMPELKKVTQIACGANHALALDNKGNVTAWGSGQQNQLGRRMVERTAVGGLTPREFGLPKNKIKFVAAGHYHSFAIEKNGRVWAWGANSYCETGIRDNVGEDSTVVEKPTIVEGLAEYDIVYIASGSHHSTAVTKEGDMLVWGRLDGCQTGAKPSELPDEYVTRDQNNVPRILHKPYKIPGLKVKTVAAGSDNNIAITPEGKAYAWGFSTNYQTGLGTEDDVEVPTLIDNTAVRGKKLTWAGCGGQYSMLAGPAEEDIVMTNGITNGEAAGNDEVVTNGDVVMNGV